MTQARPAARQRWRTGRSVVLALIAITLVAAATTYLTAPRPGGRMDPASTSPEGAHALVALLHEHGVEVTVADGVADVERAARPDTLVVVAQTFYLADDDQLRRLNEVPGDLLLVDPVPRIREALAPKIRLAGVSSYGGRLDCELPEAIRAGEVQLGISDTYEAATDIDLTRCYDGAVVRYIDAGRTTTVVGSAEFMMNGGLLKRGNAALAMNLAGGRPRVIWYAPQRMEGQSPGGATVSDLIPGHVRWILWQLCLVVALLAIWKARRIGPLVAERLPVVVRASETVEGRGRLYRSRRSRDRAADALRTAALHRLAPRLGLGAGASPAAVAEAVAARTGQDPTALSATLFGPPPESDADLVHLAHRLDDIERQVAQS